MICFMMFLEQTQSKMIEVKALYQRTHSYILSLLFCEIDRAGSLIIL
jgi:hypothetical protein